MLDSFPCPLISLCLPFYHIALFSSEPHSQTHTATCSCTSRRLQRQAITGTAVAGSHGYPAVSPQMCRLMYVIIHWAACYLLTCGFRDSEIRKTLSLPLKAHCLIAQRRVLSWNDQLYVLYMYMCENIYAFCWKGVTSQASTEAVTTAMWRSLLL